MGARAHSRGGSKVIEPSFPDTDLDTLIRVVENYKAIGAWCSEPAMKQESFERLQTVMQQAGELAQK